MLKEQWLQRFFNRRDCHGQYAQGRSWTEKQPIKTEKIARHIEGVTVLGAHTTDPESQTCRWCCWDFDDHDGTTDNDPAAMRLCDELTKAGMDPMLEDSNGAGGRHVWLFFKDPVPADELYRWMRTFEAGGAECFPKQPRVVPGGYGNFMRLPGRHHKRDHWSRVWDGGEWIEDLAPVVASWPLSPPPEPIGGIPGDDTQTPPVPPHVATRGNEGVCSPDLSQAAALIYRLPAIYRDEYDRWIKVGMCLHAICPDSAGLALWKGWSQQSPKHREGDCEQKWPTFKSHDHPEPVGIGTLFRIVGDDPSDELMERITESARSEGHERSHLLNLLSQTIGVKVIGWVQRGDDGNEQYYLQVSRGSGSVAELPVGTARQLVSSSQPLRAALYAAGIRFVNSKALSGKKWESFLECLMQVREYQEVPEENPGEIFWAAIRAYLEEHPPVELDSNSRKAVNQFMAGRPVIHRGNTCLQASHFLRRCKIDSIMLPPYPSKLWHPLGFERRTISCNSTSRSYRILPKTAPPL